ncbi:SUF system Fe-S cluster assembly protein [Alkalilimnicola ehrlichii]|uniref:SUF system Fe-S cluster assembly protein n=1 Tax=Alkalilimnicola ehrlichii TaxID=351052 RepID=A0A3E0X0Q4_9GAMM|nr:SUF system Fe-S cluster assembly protein [Alkalilimnicola ehrlichii]RFA31058.1 SUF system Fe-S cluster assembly protein [Alkalilimnicola ehrlichii]RFA39014.1 SUF system Fe-S cluster assembly protein [Alkalilimnicola ehrlichii]
MSDEATIVRGGNEELREQVTAALKSVYDPEIPVDVFELGLIYDCEIDEEGHVDIQMTLTAPTCPVAGTMPGMIKSAVEQVPDVQSAEVELVWEPPWSMEKMSEAAKFQLGFM